MKVIYLEDIDIKGHLKSGYVDLYDRGGNKHRVDALFVPGYDWVPCAKKLLNNFTDDARLLALVLTEQDPNTAYSSTIWITRPKVSAFGNWDELEADNNTISVSDFFDRYKIKKGKRLFVIRTCKSVDIENEDNWSAFDFCLGLAKGFNESDKPIYSYFIYPAHLLLRLVALIQLKMSNTF